MAQTVNSVTTHYTLDLAGGLTQVLADGEHTYLYGAGRIAQYRATATAYFLGDALGSVRQLADGNGEVALAKSYQPFGETLSSAGDGESAFAFTGEAVDSTGLVYLRARYLDPAQGRFISRDTWDGDDLTPISYNRWLYGFGNPINFSDPSGNNPLVAALVPAIVGFGATVLGAAAAGGIYGLCTYERAIAGDCGCEIQQQALSMSRWEYAGANALAGGLIGAAAIAMGTAAYASPLGAVVVGGIGVTVSLVDLKDTVNIIRNEAGLTWCTVTRLLLDVAGTVAGMASGSAGIRGIVRAWRANGSLLWWVNNDLLPPLEGGSGLRNVRMYTSSDFQKVQEFWPKAARYNRDNGRYSFGPTWEAAARSNPDKLYLYEVNGEIRGMMLADKNGRLGYYLKMLEGMGGGAGTNLFKFAAEEAVSRGESLYLEPAEQATGFYDKFPGYNIDAERGTWTWSVDALKAILRR